MFHLSDSNKIGTKSESGQSNIHFGHWYRKNTSEFIINCSNEIQKGQIKAKQLPSRHGEITELKKHVLDKLLLKCSGSKH